MKRLVQCLIIVFILFVFNTKIDAKVSNTEYSYYLLKTSTVSLTIERSNNRYYSCSGIIIKNTEKTSEILTAKHCTEKAISITVNGSYYATKIVEAGNIDVAYLTTNRPITFTTPIELNNQNANILSKIYTLGYPANNERYSIGKILLKIGDSFYSNASVISGCSGSGVINDKGQLIGILWGGNQIDTMSAYIEISHILKFLNQINVIPWK